MDGKSIKEGGARVFRGVGMMLYQQRDEREHQKQRAQMFGSGRAGVLGFRRGPFGNGEIEDPSFLLQPLDASGDIKSLPPPKPREGLSRF